MYARNFFYLSWTTAVFSSSIVLNFYVRVVSTRNGNGIADKFVRKEFFELDCPSNQKFKAGNKTTKTPKSVNSNKKNILGEMRSLSQPSIIWRRLTHTTHKLRIRSMPHLRIIFTTPPIYFVCLKYGSVFG